MCQGVADEVVVVVKPAANEGMVTYRRVKLPERDRDVKGEGRNMKSSIRRTLLLTGLSSAAVWHHQQAWT